MVMPLRNDTTNIVTNNSTAKSPTARIGRLCLVNDTKKSKKEKLKKTAKRFNERRFDDAF